MKRILIIFALLTIAEVTFAQEADSTSVSLSQKKTRPTGYRVQVYAGGNSRDAKMKALQMEGKVTALFPEMAVYTRFVSPRWVCHVGDFLTREEASEFLHELRSVGRFDEAIVVKCKINHKPEATPVTSILDWF